MSVKPKKITVADVEPLVDKFNGNVAAIARALGVSRGTVWNRIHESSTLRSALEQAREVMLDNAESVLYKKVLEGSTAELIFFLKTRGKQRGYVERVELAHAVEARVREELGEALDRLERALPAGIYEQVVNALGSDEPS